MEFLPIFLDIKERHCVLVGGGEVAYRKALLLIKAQAKLIIVATNFCDSLVELANGNSFVRIDSDFSPRHLQDAILVIAATDDEHVNAFVAETAAKENIPVNVVDQPALCSFIMPAIVDRSPVVVAISSGGKSPVLTRKIKTLNESMISDREGDLALLLGEYRDAVKERFSSFNERLRFWEELLESELTELVYSGKTDAAKELIVRYLTTKKKERLGGEVYLVGAGPGDPDLLTLRALRLMHKADVVLYDRLVSPEVMNKLRPDAEKIHVGKARSNHTVEQESINQMLVRYAREGKRVLRLKGGDPFIFGRGGEELSSLTNAEIPFQVVPGITAASGCASYAGIPLTHRDYAQSVRFLTGHLKDGELILDWKNLVQEHETLVFYMGLLGISTICEQLVKHGMEASMPIAVVQQGTRRSQRVLSAELKTMPALIENSNLKAPTIIIIGKVVDLRAELNWYNPQ
ncbi:MAG: siroheme synthase CysG [Gammaproteobacteria bacterium]|jgi:uroporphyrin-III C-methyltransferase / precorrin-2 dehydrogenase / sirohydrochlorin ferrochelatase|nr:siroheme synthase CysG [Gammaproteobacteria bacterium]